ncbi:MAG: phage head closure protein [Alphaproteobacteria bacterium]|nr:phage head closure protein [Alphaproteobacteria bacterium]
MTTQSSAGSDMRHRITLQQPLLTPDGAGGYARTWQDVADMWAAIAPLAPNRPGLHRETLVDMHVQSHALYRFTLRYYPGITAAMRVLYGARLFNIRAVIDPDETKTTLQLLAEEGVAT